MKKRSQNNSKRQLLKQEIEPHDILNPPSIDTKAIPAGPWDPAIQKHIRHLIQEISAPHVQYENEDTIVEIMVTALKAVQSQIGRGDLKLLSRTVRELRYAFKIFKDYSAVRKITIFGSARAKNTDADYKMAKEFSKKLAQNGYMIITGAGPGIMEAGNEGAGPENSFGVNIRLPFEQEPNKFIARQPTYIDCKYFFTRKLVFIKEASGALILPGGFGTLDEAFELLTLVQTGKCNPIPIVLMEPAHTSFWKSMDDFIKKRLLKMNKISSEDLHLYKIVHNVDEACNEIFSFYSNYHSMRYVGDKLVVRVQKPFRQDQLNYLNKNFSDILVSGKFSKGKALEAELNQPDIAHLPRLIFNYNRVNNGRLRQLIDYLNSNQ